MSVAAFSPQAYYVAHVRDWGGLWRVNHEVVFTLPEQLGIDLCREMKPVEVTRDDGAAPGTYMPRTMDSHLLAEDERTCEVTMSMCAPTDTVPVVRLGDLVRLYESDNKEKEETVEERDQKRYGVRFVEATPLLDETGTVCGLCLTGVDRPRKGLTDQPRWRYQASVRFDEFGECMTALRRERMEQARTEEGMWARARSAEEIEERVADRMALIDRLLLVETIERLIEEKGEATGEYHPQNAATI